MQILKYILTIFSILSFETLISRINISEVINNTNDILELAYPMQLQIKIVSSKSIKTGEHSETQIKSIPQKTGIMLPPLTIISLEGVFIPEESKGSAKSGINIGYNGLQPFNPAGVGGGNGVRSLIAQKKDSIELTPIEGGQEQFSKRKVISPKNLIANEKYILEINNNDVSLYLRTKEKIDSYLNPSKLQPQELLNQAIVNNSSQDIKEAIKLGANVNVGIGNQPPLLLAIIMDKWNSAEELLIQGANPNIQYLNKPLLLYILRRNNYKFAQALLKKDLKLNDAEKNEIIDYIMFQSAYRIDQLAIDILKTIGYNIKDNFDNSDISKNKWYQLLVRQFMGTSAGQPFGHAGLPSLDLVSLFLKNGANANKIFHKQDGTAWTPLLLVINNYIGLESKQCNPDIIGQIIKALLEAGANINMSSPCLSDKKEASPLSYLLTYDSSNCVIDILVKSGANIASAIQLFLQNGGDANKSFRFWEKSGSWTLLWLAIENNNPEAVRLLVKAGVYKDPTLLKLAISKGYSAIINILMS